MPELHNLTPPLGVLLDKGFKVALVTDGRMSGASGKVPAAIHVTPEAADGGPLAYVRDGDIIRVDALAGELTIKVDPAELAARPRAAVPPLGRGLWPRAVRHDAPRGGSGRRRRLHPLSRPPR